jgi:hypothetical protein
MNKSKISRTLGMITTIGDLNALTIATLTASSGKIPSEFAEECFQGDGHVHFLPEVKIHGRCYTEEQWLAKEAGLPYEHLPRKTVINKKTGLPRKASTPYIPKDPNYMKPPLSPLEAIEIAFEGNAKVPGRSYTFEQEFQNGMMSLGEILKGIELGVKNMARNVHRIDPEGAPVVALWQELQLKILNRILSTEDHYCGCFVSDQGEWKLNKVEFIHMATHPDEVYSKTVNLSENNKRIAVKALHFLAKDSLLSDENKKRARDILTRATKDFDLPSLKEVLRAERKAEAEAKRKAENVDVYEVPPPPPPPPPPPTHFRR